MYIKTFFRLCYLQKKKIVPNEAIYRNSINKYF